MILFHISGRDGRDGRPGPHGPAGQPGLSGEFAFVIVNVFVFWMPIFRVFFLFFARLTFEIILMLKADIFCNCFGIIQRYFVFL